MLSNDNFSNSLNSIKHSAQIIRKFDNYNGKILKCEQNEMHNHIKQMMGL